LGIKLSFAFEKEGADHLVERLKTIRPQRASLCQPRQKLLERRQVQVAHLFHSQAEAQGRLGLALPKGRLEALGMSECQ